MSWAVPQSFHIAPGTSRSTPWDTSTPGWESLLLNPPRRKGGGESVHCCVNASLYRAELKVVELSRKRRWRGVSADDLIHKVTYDTVFDLIMTQGWVVLLSKHLWINRAPGSDGSVVQAKNITRQSMFPNKSLLLSAHNHLNNIDLMGCRSTQGVELLGGTHTATTIIYSNILKWSGLQEHKHINDLVSTWYRNESLSSYLDQQWKGAFSLP